MNENSPEEDDHILYEQPPSHNLLCPICKDVFTDPVILIECNHSFCKICIEQCCIHDSVCPLCRTHIMVQNVHQNLILKSIIDELNVLCKRKCGWKGFLQDLKIHDSSCPNRIVICFNFDYGCTWKGLSSSLPSHITSCPFESLKDWIHKVELTMNAFSNIINSQNKTIRYLLKKDEFMANNDHESITNDTHDEHNTLQSFVQDIPIPFNRHILSSQDDKFLTNPMKEILHPLKKRERVIDVSCDGHFMNHKSGVTSISSHQNLLFSSSHDTTISVLDINEDHQPIQRLTGHHFTVWSLLYSPQTNVLVSGSADKTIRIWNCDQGQSEISLMDILESEDQYKVYSLCKGASSSLYASTFQNIVLWDMNTFKKIGSLKGHDQAIWNVKIYGDQLISCSDDGSIKIWDQRKLEAIETLKHENSQFLSIEKAGGYIFSGTNDGHIKVWSSSTFEYITTLKSHQWEVWQLIQSGEYLISGSYDHTIKFWDLNDLRCKKTLNAHKGTIHALHGYKEREFYSGGGDKSVNKWKYRIKEEEED